MFSDEYVQTNSQGLLQRILSSSRLLINKNTLQWVENVSSGDIW